MSPEGSVSFQLIYLIDAPYQSFNPVPSVIEENHAVRFDVAMFWAASYITLNLHLVAGGGVSTLAVQVVGEPIHLPMSYHLILCRTCTME